jgi:predicted  nucleic acid-binding Zn-ribbon protein
MSEETSPLIQTSRKPTLGDRIRGIANQLRQENDVQIKATSRILGAAAQIAQNHDHLIDEVVDMVEEDLDQQAQVKSSEPYTVAQLQQQFKTLKDAKVHFAVKAASWTALVSKLNEPMAKHSPQYSKTEDAVTQRLGAIEHELQTIRGDINQVLNLLNLIVEKLP